MFGTRVFGVDQNSDDKIADGFVTHKIRNGDPLEKVVDQPVQGLPHPKRSAFSGAFAGVGMCIETGDWCKAAFNGFQNAANRIGIRRAV